MSCSYMSCIRYTKAIQYSTNIKFAIAIYHVAIRYTKAIQYSMH